MKPQPSPSDHAVLVQLRQRCRQNFLRQFPNGFQTEQYKDQWNILFNAHVLLNQTLSKEAFEELLFTKQFEEISKRALSISERSNLLLPFEQMALNHALSTSDGMEIIARALHHLLYRARSKKEKFERFSSSLVMLPRKHVRVVTWPLQTLFLFLSNPDQEIFIQPRVIQMAAESYGFPLQYKANPNWQSYQSMLSFSELLWKDLQDLLPGNMIDVYLFMKCQGIR
jgi:hypothetical protein